MMTTTKVLVIHDWMHALRLTDKQEKLYALIYGYSQDGVSRMRGTAASIAEWLGCSRKHAITLLRELEDRGLIAHEVTRTMKATFTEFWALAPATEETRPERPDRREWFARPGSNLRVTTDSNPEVTTESNLEVTTDNIAINTKGSNQKNGCSKNGAGRAGTTTTTGFLFGEELLKLPFEEPFFIEAWKRLCRQPVWERKSPDALQITLDRFAATGDPVLSAFCCIKAIELGWKTINDPAQLGLDDADQLLAYSESLKARQEGAQA